MVGDWCRAVCSTGESALDRIEAAKNFIERRGGRRRLRRLLLSDL
jgi:hypothetical protein